MRWAFWMTLSVVALLSAGVGQAEEPVSEDQLKKLATRALTSCSRSYTGYCKQLREHGEAGLAALLELKNSKGVKPQRWSSAVDHVAGARYSSRSGLYWHTDLDKALAASKATGKPVLSLRMLGRLCDEYSCANSRFFRTTLYSAPDISQLMKDKFILHWKTVRPVPVMTIDFGDGRVLKRTITGNSAHYVLDQTGKPLDVLPGLQAPIAFRQWLNSTADLHEQYKQAETPALVLRRYHRAAERRIERAIELFRRPASISADDPSENYWTTTIGLLDQGRPAPPVLPPSAKAGGRNVRPKFADDNKTKPAAVRATEIAQPKMSVQAPLVNNVVNKRELMKRLARLGAKSPKATPPQAKNPSAAKATRIAAPKRLVENALVRNVRPEEYKRVRVDLRETEIPAVAAAHPELTHLHPVTMSIMMEERSHATTRDGSIDKDAAVRLMMDRLAKGIAEDTVRNEFDFHLQVHRWYAAGDVTDVETLDRKVYGELFLMPLDDEWLGLVPGATYSALENDGLVRDRK